MSHTFYTLLALWEELICLVEGDRERRQSSAGLRGKFTRREPDSESRSLEVWLLCECDFPPTFSVARNKYLHCEGRECSEQRREILNAHRFLEAVGKHTSKGVWVVFVQEV